MQRRVMQWHRVIGFALVLFLAAGCFQAVGTDFQATDAANARPTFTPIPSVTPFPTNTPPPEETEPADITFGPVDTTTDALALLTPADVSIAQAPTQDPNVVLPEPTLDPILQTVTAIYVQGDQVLAAQETQAPPEPLDPIAITATHIVERATLTQAALEGNPVQFPTATPPADQAQTSVTQQGPVTNVPGADCIHEVRATDRNLYRIALNYGVTVQQIAQASGIVNPDLIYVGQKLTIPGCGTTGAQPLPTSTPTGGAVGVPAQTGATAVPGVTFTPVPSGQTVPTTRTHTVMQGETLFEISLQYGVTVHQIAAVNGIANINRIYIGQVLTIP